MCSIFLRNQPDHEPVSAFPVSEWINGFMGIYEETEVKATYYETAFNMEQETKKRVKFHKTNDLKFTFSLESIINSIIHISNS